MLVPLLACVSTPAPAQQVSFDIPKQPAVTDIPAFARQAGIQIVSPVSRIGRQQTRAVHGRYSVDAALAILLRGTGLKVAVRNGNTVSLSLTPTISGIAPGLHPKRVRLAPRSAGGERIMPDPDLPIIVTETRIRRPQLGSAMPIAVVGMDDAKNFGHDTVYDALMRNPAIGPGLGLSNSQGDTWNVGVANINLRNMGVNRSLVLVDGKRWVSGGARTSAVDLNGIPDAMIDRFEIVTGGAAAIYGADAVTGAVNIIMKAECHRPACFRNHRHLSTSRCRRNQHFGGDQAVARRRCDRVFRCG